MINCIHILISKFLSFIFNHSTIFIFPLFLLKLITFIFFIFVSFVFLTPNVNSVGAKEGQYGDNNRRLISSCSAGFFVFNDTLIDILFNIYTTFTVSTFIQRITNVCRNSKYLQNFAESVILSPIAACQFKSIDNPKNAYTFPVQLEFIIELLSSFEAMNNYI